MGAGRVRADQAAQGAEVRRETRGVGEGRVLLRRAAEHALGERGGLQSAGLRQLEHVGVEPDGAVLGELEEEWIRRVTAVGRVLDRKVSADSVRSQQQDAEPSRDLVGSAELASV